MAEGVSYKDAGVDIESGNQLVKKLKDIVAETNIPGVMGKLGGFGGCFDLSKYPCQHPVLVSTTDGVGTKLRLAIDHNHHHTVGIDLVAMCVNDLIVMGAKPLFFLDYFATGKLDTTKAQQVISGIAQGCKIANTALTGGETAEMPGMYQVDDYDLAGFCVGIVDKPKILTGENIETGDAVIAIPSSGPHSNGYSLIRYILEKNNIDLQQDFNGEKLISTLLRPTEIYVKPILHLHELQLIKGAAHITGGGLIDNIPRILPEDLGVHIDCSSWQLPETFSFLQQQAKLSNFELRRTFNCGVGMVVVVSPDQVTKTIDELKGFNITAWQIGNIISHNQNNPLVSFSDE